MQPKLRPTDRFTHHPAFCPRTWGAAIPTAKA
jgi:hypothetical protein